MNVQDVKNITIKALEIQIKEAAAKGRNCIDIDYTLPEFIIQYFEKKGYTIAQYKLPRFEVVPIVFGCINYPAIDARIEWK